MGLPAQTERMVMANQQDIMVVNEQQKKGVVIEKAIPSNSNIRKKEHEKLGEYQGLREELEKMSWRSEHSLKLGDYIYLYRKPTEETETLTLINCIMSTDFS